MQVFYFGVADGARTHDNWNHNPGLYQLSYSHHWFLLTLTGHPILVGAPRRIRTLGLTLRRGALYPTELWAPYRVSAAYSRWISSSRLRLFWVFSVSCSTFS